MPRLCRYAIFGFPLALTIIVFTGTDLFTSSCMYALVGPLEGRQGALKADSQAPPVGKLTFPANMFCAASLHAFALSCTP